MPCAYLQLRGIGWIPGVIGPMAEGSGGVALEVRCVADHSLAVLVLPHAAVLLDANPPAREAGGVIGFDRSSLRRTQTSNASQIQLMWQPCCSAQRHIGTLLQAGR